MFATLEKSSILYSMQGYCFLFSFFFFFFLSWVFVPTCRLFVVVASGGYSLVEVSRLLIAVASVVAEHRL